MATGWACELAWRAGRITASLWPVLLIALFGISLIVGSAWIALMFGASIAIGLLCPFPMLVGVLLIFNVAGTLLIREDNPPERGFEVLPPMARALQCQGPSKPENSGFTAETQSSRRMQEKVKV